MDIFGALLNGATLYPMNIKQEGLANLSVWLREQEITIYHSTPTVYRYLIGSLAGEKVLPRIRLVVLGGEEVFKRDVTLYKKQFGPDCIFVNGLGPTESTVSLQYFINSQTEITKHTVPVGYPVEDTEISLLNEAGEQTAVYGEIAIRSPHIALGYWRKPELTAAAFLADPEGGARRIYRTGDMGRLVPDGRLEFVGRRDFQVKIRGFRIELREIEAVVANHPAVQEALVVVREDGRGEKRLVAYIVSTPDNMPTANELRTFLKLKLPDYMIPSAFVRLEALPLNPNGKINRQALPEPDLAGLEHEKVVVAPRDTLETQLVKIWEEVLGFQPIGVKCNFFELGGHSLLVVRLSAQVEKTFGQSLPLAAFFQAPTVEQLANVLRKRQVDEPTSQSSLVAIQPNGSKQPFFCVPGNLGNVFVDLGDLARHLGPEQPFYGLQDGLQNPSQIKALASHYITEIRSVQPKGPYLLGGFCWGGVVAFEIAQQLQAAGQRVALLVLVEPVPPPFYKLPLYLGILKSLIYRITRRFAHHSQNLLQQDALENRAYLGLKTKLIANMWAVARYTPQPYPGQITLFIAEEGSPIISCDPRLNWEKLATDGLKIYSIPGSHETITRVDNAVPQEAQIKILAERLRGCLEAAML
jgi:thioesterase domain-containing protein/acyl carrier protein